MEQLTNNYPKEVYINGDWQPHANATVSVFDRGFLLGDGIYEVIPFYSGKPFRLEDHLRRLQYCLNEIGIEFKASSLIEIIETAIIRADLSSKDCAIYIQVTRGVAPRTHFYPENITPTVLLYAYPVTLLGFEKKEVKVLVSKDRRWGRCDIKSISLMANVMANSHAHSLGLAENLLVRKGYFTEGSHTSIFFVKDRKIHTYPEGSHILSGITRKVVLEICRQHEIPIVEKGVHIDELVEVDEIFLAGTTTQVLAVKSITSTEKEIYKKEEKGKITAKIQHAFIELSRG